MPSIRRRPGKRTVYLDTSALIDAARAKHPDPAHPVDPATVDLLALVERVSRECSLCLSTMHIAELAHGREDSVRTTFAWLDSLDLVWMYSFDKVGDREDDHALQLAVGATPEAPVDPFAASMLSAFEHWNLDSLAEALASRSPLQALAQAARDRGRASEHALIDQLVVRFHYDRHHDPETLAMTDAERTASVARKRREGLGSEAARAFTRLRGRDLPDFHAKYRALASPHEVFADYVLARPTAQPSTFVAESFGAAFAEVMARRTPGGGGARKLRSSFYDYAHLGIGAAYCDVFTCDQLAAECLGDAPEKVERARPVVFANDMPAFVAALERAAFASHG